MDKSKLRRELSSHIASFSEEYVSSSDRAIFERLLALPELNAAKRVFAYCSVGREVDTKALINHCFERGIPLALPRTERNRRMSFAPVASLNELFPSAFGIPEPDKTLPALVPTSEDIIIVPALCYDALCYRLGHGGGYYDRFLEGCPAFTVGLCREALLCGAVPREAHDLPVSAVITEKKIARPV